MIFNLIVNPDTLEATSDDNGIIINSVSDVDGVLNIEVSMTDPSPTNTVSQVNT